MTVLAAQDNHQRIAIVQAVRAVCMLVVLIGHVVTSIGLASPFEYGSNASQVIVLLSLAGISVIDMFFVGSGFVIFYVSHQNFGQPGARREFLLRRFTRIIPPYWFYLTLGVIFAYVWPTVFTQDPTVARVIKSYFFIPFAPDGAMAVTPMPYPVLSVGWTLNLEMMFYLLFALFMGSSLKRGLAYFSALAIGLAVLHMFVPLDWTLAYYWTSPFVLKFLIGCLIGYAYVRGVRWNVPRWLAVVIIVVALVVQAAVLIGSGGMALQATWYHAFSALTMGLVGMMAVLTPLSQTRIPAIVERAGDSTYSIYLSQVTFMMVCVVIPGTLLGVNGLTATIMAVTAGFACIAWGMWSFTRIELPLSGFLRVRLRRFFGMRAA